MDSSESIESNPFTAEPNAMILSETYIFRLLSIGIISSAQCRKAAQLWVPQRAYRGPSNGDIYK